MGVSLCGDWGEHQLDHCPPDLERLHISPTIPWIDETLAIFQMMSLLSGFLGFDTRAGRLSNGSSEQSRDGAARRHSS